MTDVRWAEAPAVAAPLRGSRRWSTPRLARVTLTAIVIGFAVAGFAWGDGPATSKAVTSAGSDLTRLLRFMALIKGVFALAACGAVLWRLGSQVSFGRFVTYAACCGTMATGPGLIWGMVHVGLGALVLHGGLAALLVLLWRDPAIPARLETAVARRRPPYRNRR